MTPAHAFVGAMVAAILAIGGCAAPEEQSPDSSAEEEAPAEETDSEVTCKDVADEAVRISEESDENAVTLLKVRKPKITKDKRDTYKEPKGADEAVVLVCRGRGVWSDGSNSPVRLKLTVDADGDHFVEYEPIV